MTAKRKPVTPVLDPEPIRLQTAHGLVCLLYRRQPPPPPEPAADPWGEIPPPPWEQPDLDEHGRAILSPADRAALGL